MPSELGRRAMLGNNENSFGDEFEKEIGFLLQRRQEGDDLEKELNLYRSGSAPPTVDGSLNAVGGLFNHGGNGFVSEEEIRSHPSYLSHYYSNVNLNPRLPPPLLSREDWRLAQRLQGGNSAIGDRRNKQESKDMDSVEWGGDGLIGLPRIGLDSRQKSLAEIFKDDLSHNTLVSPHASRPASRNAIDENTNAMGSNLSYSYAAALGASVSRTSTPDPQLIARAASPCPTPIGGGRVRNSEKRNVNNGVSSLSKEAADLVSTLSGLNLSNGVADDGSRLSYHIEPNPNSHNNYPFNLEGGRNNSNFGQAEPQKFVLQSNNSYGKRSPYQHFGSPNSSFSNYGSGYPISPISGQLGSSNSPLLFDNAAAAFGIDTKIANHMGGSVQPPFVDPSYLHYLNGGEFSTPPLNDPTFNRNSYLGDSYMDLLQKAYIGNYLPVGGKSGLSSPNGYYGSPPFGIGLSYPDSAGGPYSPIRHGGFNMAFPSFGSSLLEEFKSNKAKCMELSDIAGHVVEFSTDQYGSRFIQQKLETATIEEKNMVFEEILPQALMLITGVFGNYVVQKFFEHGLASQRRELADKLIGHVLTLSLQMYGCRVIQKAIEVVDVYQKIKMVGELDGHVMQCVRDQNGNHVIQKCIECIPEEHIQFIVSTFFNQVVTLSTHPYGCRVIQRVLEHCEDEKTQKKVMDEILGSVSLLAQDQYGNYVVQHVLEHGKPRERSTIIRELAGKIVQMSQQKFASNVVEKCLTFGDPSERQFLVTEMLGTTDENEPLQAMMKDQFANYVVQKVLETCSDQQRELIMCRIKIHLNALKKYTYGKHIVARVEKLVAAGERRIAASAAAAAAQAPNAA